MPVRFVCLANSFKLHGRCLAGIMLDRKNKPLLQHDSPRWIRPVTSTEHGEVPTEIVSHIRLLDIVEIEVTDYIGKGHQSENALFDENSVEIVDRYPFDMLDVLCEDVRPLIFGNKGKAVAHEAIWRLHHSLMLIRVNDLTIIEIPSERNPDKLQTRLEFSYKKNRYDFAITDPAFLKIYQFDRNILAGTTELYITLSLALNLDDWYHKLVAGIVYQHDVLPSPKISIP